MHIISSPATVGKMLIKGGEYRESVKTRRVSSHEDAMPNMVEMGGSDL
jgi:hypothetical protein